MNYDANRITTSEGQEYQVPMHYENIARDFVPVFSEFLKTFCTNNLYIYSDQLLSNFDQGLYLLTVRYTDLYNFDSALALRVESNPTFYLNQLSEACKDLIGEMKNERPRVWQIALSHYEKPAILRGLGASSVGKLVNVQGILTGSSKIGARATQLHLVCLNCRETRIEQTGNRLGSVQLPRSCSNTAQQHCPLDPFLVVADKSFYEDFQLLKLQEFPEEVPPGEVPRQVRLLVSGAMVGYLKTGQRVKATGVYVFRDDSAEDRLGKGSGSAKGVVVSASKQSGYLHVLGSQSVSLELVTEITHRKGLSFATVWNSIAPGIFGMDAVKKAIACQLFGGTNRKLQSGARLRGDIHVLLLGDPSVAKSQFLKFAEKSSPIAVYTSGKGSSAAGLTAAVVRDTASGEFCLEGGAMVLADKGLVCIDEFDKMRESDRVAIHEAMEQQTISIAKAGITSVLSSRTSVLAAANPAFGRYDPLRSTADNVEFQATILSRFDLIFVLLDKTDYKKDLELAARVFEVHQGSTTNSTTNMLPLDTLKSYVQFARSSVFPELDEEAADFLENEYVHLRSASLNNSAFPITVRQLEAIVRITESLAKMELSSTATKEHAAEAAKIFRSATVQASKLGSKLGEGNVFGGNPETTKKLVRKVESEIRSKITVGETVSKKKLVYEISRDLNCAEINVEAVLNNLDNHKDFEVKKKTVSRRR